MNTALGVISPAGASALIPQQVSSPRISRRQVVSPDATNLEGGGA